MRIVIWSHYTRLCIDENDWRDARSGEADPGPRRTRDPGGPPSVPSEFTVRSSRVFVHSVTAG